MCDYKLWDDQYMLYLNNKNRFTAGHRRGFASSYKNPHGPRPASWPAGAIVLPVVCSCVLEFILNTQKWVIKRFER